MQNLHDHRKWFCKIKYPLKNTKSSPLTLQKQKIRANCSLGNEFLYLRRGGDELLDTLGEENGFCYCGDLKIVTTVASCPRVPSWALNSNFSRAFLDFGSNISLANTKCLLPWYHHTLQFIAQNIYKRHEHGLLLQEFTLKVFKFGSSKN